MPKKTIIDQRIDNLFAGMRPEAREARPETNRKTVPRPGPRPPRQLALQMGETNPAPTKLFLTIISIAALLLAGGIFVLYRLQAVPDSAPAVSNIIPSGSNQNAATQNSPDSQAPAVPRGLEAIPASTTSVSLTWSASSDNVDVAGYTIYRDGMSMATSPGTDTSYIDRTAAPDVTYHYALDAFDKAGNHSAISAPVDVTTPALPGSLTFLLPVADTYVNAASPKSVYGATNSLRVDGDPDVHAYLRFVVPDLAGKTIKRARLMIYSNTGSSKGIHAVAVADNNWNESTTDFLNAPPLGSELAVATLADSASWITLDITAYITGPGVYTIGLTADSHTAVNLASRETGANSPQLIIDLR